MNVSKYFFLDASIQLALVIALHTCILVILGKANSRDVFQSEEDHAHWSTGARILIGCLWFWWGVRVYITVIFFLYHDALFPKRLVDRGTMVDMITEMQNPNQDSQYLSPTQLEIMRRHVLGRKGIVMPTTATGNSDECASVNTVYSSEMYKY